MEDQRKMSKLNFITHIYYPLVLLYAINVIAIAIIINLENKILYYIFAVLVVIFAEIIDFKEKFNI